MALSFQFNKTFLHQLGKDLKIRLTALPTLKAKEAALRLEVKAAKAEADTALSLLKKKLKEMESIERLFPEFNIEGSKVSQLRMNIKKIAGVKIKVLLGVDFTVAAFSLFNSPSWFPAGIELLKSVLMLEIRKEIAEKNAEALDYARRKTTQKVNLYEKVQIPEYENAIRRIKRFLEDEDTLAKSSQKILKERMITSGAA